MERGALACGGIGKESTQAADTQLRRETHGRPQLRGGRRIVGLGPGLPDLLEEPVPSGPQLRGHWWKGGARPETPWIEESGKRVFNITQSTRLRNSLL